MERNHKGFRKGDKADLRTDFRDRDRLAESDVDVPCKAVLFDGRSGCEKTPDPGKLPIEIC